MISALRAQVVERDQAVAARDVVIEQLAARVAALEARLGKNSQNSSRPPSSDNPFTKPPPRSLRGASGRRPGKQPGDSGSRLEPRPDPDEVVVPVPRACVGCGDTLASAAAADFPAEATGPTCYGPGVAALGTYLLVRQHLPVARAAELMADCFGFPASTGWLSSLMPTLAARLEGFTTATQEQLRAAPVAHFDETGALRHRARAVQRPPPA